MPEDEIRMLGSKSIDPKQKEDRKKKIELIGLVFLVLILLYLVVTTFFKKPAKPVNPPAPAVSNVVVSGSTPAISSEKASSTAETAQKTDDNGWGSNPFSPRKSDQGGNITIQLQGVVVSGRGEAYALISDQIVKVGDRVADNTVKEIASDKVILQADTGEEVVLRR